LLYISTCKYHADIFYWLQILNSRSTQPVKECACWADFCLCSLKPAVLKLPNVSTPTCDKWPNYTHVYYRHIYCNWFGFNHGLKSRYQPINFSVNIANSARQYRDTCHIDNIDLNIFSYYGINIISSTLKRDTILLIYFGIGWYYKPWF